MFPIQIWEKNPELYCREESQAHVCANPTLDARFRTIAGAPQF